MLSLSKAFNKRKEWFNNRSSCFIPVLLNDQIDVYIIFQNYWKWKNDNNSCILNIRFYDSIGNPIKLYNQAIKDIHYEINLSEIIKSDLNTKFKENFLTAEVEIISLKNIGFPFPAIITLFISKESKEVSCVHSAGRSLNSNEINLQREFQETNWLAIENNEFTPFFHIFNPGFNSEANNKGKVSIIIDSEPNLNFDFEINLPTKPYSSNIYYLDEYISTKQSSLLNRKKFFIVVSFISYGFMRLVVGNLHKDSKFHYITHSFGKIDSNSNDLTVSDDNEISSFLPMLNQKPLNLIARSYPTNLSKKLIIKRNDYKKNCNLFKEVGSFVIDTASDKNKINSFELSESIMSLYSVFGSSPSRINCSYNYSLDNSLHPTDIATGFKSYHYPAKTNHWGHGILMKGFRTYIFFRDVNHKQLEKHSIKQIEIKFNSKNTNFTRKLNITKWNYIELSDEDFNEERGLFFSWRFSDYSSGCIETFWVSFCTKTGAICGEHGF